MQAQGRKQATAVVCRGAACPWPALPLTWLGKAASASLRRCATAKLAAPTGTKGSAGGGPGGGGGLKPPPAGGQREWLAVGGAHGSHCCAKCGDCSSHLDPGSQTPSSQILSL